MSNFDISDVLLEMINNLDILLIMSILLEVFYGSI